MTTFRYLSPARGELRNAAHYYRERSRRVAASFMIEVQKAADQLRDFGWFESFSMMQAQVRRANGNSEVAIIVNVDALDDPDVQAYFNELGAALASSSLGHSIRLELCDTPFVSSRTLDFRIDDGDEPEAPPM